MDLTPYLQETPILNYSNSAIKSLVQERNWNELNDYDKIGAVYTFVKDEISFGYNASDDLPASSVLSDGYGQCNTKGTLLMALLRSIGIACRFHGFTINNILQKGAIPAYLFGFAPTTIIHSWVEVYYDNRWINLEGFILDNRYLKSVQSKFSSVTGRFSGYGIATPNLAAPGVEWNGKDTYIQKEGIHDDFGIFIDPDSFYNTKGTNLSGLKKLLFKYVLRHLMNLNVRSVRKSGRSMSKT